MGQQVPSENTKATTPIKSTTNGRAVLWRSSSRKFHKTRDFTQHSAVLPGVASAAPTVPPAIQLSSAPVDDAVSGHTGVRMGCVAGAGGTPSQVHDVPKSRPKSWWSDAAPPVRTRARMPPAALVAPQHRVMGGHGRGRARGAYIVRV